MAPVEDDFEDDEFESYPQQLVNRMNRLKRRAYKELGMVWSSDTSSVNRHRYRSPSRSVFMRLRRAKKYEDLRVIQDAADKISTVDVVEKIRNININSSDEIAVKEGSHGVNIDSPTMEVDEVNDKLQ